MYIVSALQFAICRFHLPKRQTLITFVLGAQHSGHITENILVNIWRHFVT